MEIIKGITQKCCTVCNKVKLLSEFGKQKGGYLGLRGACKSCRNSSNKEYYNKTIEHQKIRSKLYRDSHKEQIKIYNASRKELTKTYNKQYYEKNKNMIILATAKYYKNRYHSDPFFRLKCLMRSRINTAIRNKGLKKSNKKDKYLGCTFEELYAHIESKFVEGMSWENRKEWHIDHIIPLDSAINLEDIYKLNHYTNLQPLWAKDNYSKGTKIMV